MRVMVWNVCGRFGGNWRQREESIAVTLETYRPDVLGLVASWSGEGTDQPRRLAAPCAMHAAWAPLSLPPIAYAADDGISLGLGLLSRWPILAAEQHEPPAALLATLDHPRGPLHVIVSGDHPARRRQLAELATDARLDGPLPVLLLADLDATVAGLPLQAALVDTSAEAGAVLVRPGRAGHPVALASAFVAGDRPIGGVYPSDRYAVGVDIPV